jgi:hypothetical protein
MNFIEWKWSYGENFERSKRVYRNSHNNNNTNEQPPINMEAIKENAAYLQSLNIEENWNSQSDPYSENQFMSQQNSLDFSTFKNSNKREDSYNRMAEREMMSTTGMNPFLDNNNYVKDVVARDLFLKPLSTTTEKEINS